MNTETLNERKINLIVRITKLDKEDAVRKIEETIDGVEKRPTREQMELLKKLAKPRRKTLDIEELKREQNWKPIDRKEFDKKIEDFNWQILEDEFIELLKDI